MKTTNNRPTLVNKFQGFRCRRRRRPRRQNRVVYNVRQSLVPTDERTRTKWGVRVFKATSAIVPQASAGFLLLLRLFLFCKGLCVDLIIWCIFSGCEERTDHQQRFKQVIVVRGAVQIPAPSSTTTCRAWIYIAHGTLDARVYRSSVVEFKMKKKNVCGTPAKDNSESRLWVIELCWSVRPRFRLDRVTGLGSWLISFVYID